MKRVQRANLDLERLQDIGPLEYRYAIATVKGPDRWMTRTAPLAASSG
jgi:hypothetical protein